VHAHPRVIAWQNTWASEPAHMTEENQESEKIIHLDDDEDELIIAHFTTEDSDECEITTTYQSSRN
jgi:hypothetical protein